MYIRVQDKIGNYSKRIKIDTKSPEIEVTYSTKELTNGKVTVMLVADENIEVIEGWDYVTNLSKNMLMKTFDKNIEPTSIEVQDMAGNKTTVEIEIDNIKTKIDAPEVTYNPSKEAGYTSKSCISWR